MFVNALLDTLLTAIAKLGGLNRQEAQAQGIDPAHFNLRGYQIHRVFAKAGRSFDAMAETLAQDGYPVTNEHGKGCPNALLDVLTLALSGVKIMTSEGLEYAYQHERAQQGEHENAWIDATYADYEESILDDCNEAEQAAALLLADAVAALGEDQAVAIYDRVCVATADLEADEFLTALETAFNEAGQIESQADRTEVSATAQSPAIATIATATVATIATATEKGKEGCLIRTTQQPKPYALQIPRNGRNSNAKQAQRGSPSCYRLKTPPAWLNWLKSTAQKPPQFAPLSSLFAPNRIGLLTPDLIRQPANNGLDLAQRVRPIYGLEQIPHRQMRVDFSRFRLRMTQQHHPLDQVNVILRQLRAVQMPQRMSMAEAAPDAGRFTISPDHRVYRRPRDPAIFPVMLMPLHLIVVQVDEQNRVAIR